MHIFWIKPFEPSLSLFKDLLQLSKRLFILGQLNLIISISKIHFSIGNHIKKIEKKGKKKLH